jgi:hypothetical protein
VIAGLALLVVLEALTPAERLAFVLHDVFGVVFADIATALDRSEAAAQQLASRAVAAHTTTYSRLYPFVRPALVNGAAGAIVAPRGRLVSVMAFTVTNGKIVRIDALLDPDRLPRLDLSFPPIADEHR